MKNSRLLLFLICLVLTGIPIFFGCNTGDTPPETSKTPQTPQTDPVPAEFVGTWKNTDPAKSDWQMEIKSDSKFTFSGTVDPTVGLVTAGGDLAKDRATGTYTITATEVTTPLGSLPPGMVTPLSGVDMTIGTTLTITPPTPPEGETPHIMAGFIGGTYTKQ
jgi:hypothetical protein